MIKFIKKIITLWNKYWDDWEKEMDKLPPDVRAEILFKMFHRDKFL